MDRLLHVIVFTHAIEKMRAFYSEHIRLEPGMETPSAVIFNTGGANLSVLAVPPAQRLEFELCFMTDDTDAQAQALRERGVGLIDEPKDEPFGRIVHARDPEGNLLSWLKPSWPVADSTGGSLTTAVLNCRDLAAAKAYYRDRVGLKLLVDSPWWVEFETGATRLALHPFVDHGVLEAHHAQPVTIGFASGDLDEWVLELHLRGVAFQEEITDRGFGRFAELQDPDGNTIVLREYASSPTFEEKLAEEYETDDPPHQVAIRPPSNKNARALSRLSVRPDYHTGTPKPASSNPADALKSFVASGPATVKKTSARPGPSTGPTRASFAKAAAGTTRAARKTAATHKVARKPASVRGEGPDHARLAPKQTKDPKRARAREAVGHQTKAAARSLESQKRAQASASRAKPVKRAVARTPARNAAAQATRTGAPKAIRKATPKATRKVARKAVRKAVRKAAPKKRVATKKGRR